MEEAWLSGPLQGVSPLLMPAAHALVQASRDISNTTKVLTAAEIWAQPGGVNSVGFQLKHIAGSIDRLLTYCRDEQLNTAQLEALSSENDVDEHSNALVLTNSAVKKIDEALKVIEATTEETLLLKRFVGRKKLPTNVFGLLFHIAEHTQRHVGQIVTTTKIVVGRRV